MRMERAGRTRGRGRGNGREGGSDGETQYRGRKGVKCKGRKGKVR